MPQYPMPNVLAKVNNYAVARNNRFEVFINPPLGLNASPIMKMLNIDTERISFMCDQSAFPGKSITTKEVLHHGPLRKSPYGQVFADATFTFRVGADMYEKIFFEEWQNLIVDPATFQFSYYNQYTTDIEVKQLTIDDRVVHVVKLYEAWPMAVPELSLDHSSENTTHKLNITFAYRRWKATAVGLINNTPTIAKTKPKIISESADDINKDPMNQTSAESVTLVEVPDPTITPTPISTETGSEKVRSASRQGGLAGPPPLNPPPYQQVGNERYYTYDGKP